MRLSFFVLLFACPVFAADPPKPRYETRADHDPEGTGKFYLGREIAPVMGYRAAEWLERKERVKEEEPAKLIKALDVKEGMVIADVGAGSGYHTFLLAPLVGEKGKIIACDIQQEMLDLIERKAKKQNVTNVERVKGTETTRSCRRPASI